MPALSSTMTEGKIVEWLKKPGDPVARGESVLVVESDKADMDVESFNEGFLAAVLMPAGGTAPVGETIGLIVETEAEIAEVAAKAPAAPAAASAPAPVAAVAPPTSTAPAPAPVSVAVPVAVPAPLAVAAPAPVASGRVVASPRAKKLASQHGVALDSLRGSGPHGRIQAEDVERALGLTVAVPRVAEGSGPAVVAAAGNGAALAASAPAGEAFGRPGESVGFNTLQNAVNRNMVASLQVPCFRVGYTITTTKLDAFYKQVKPKGVTMTALLAKAVGVVLARHPQVNAATSADGSAMSFPAAVNVAVAVAMEDGGLITPVLANADKAYWNLYSAYRELDVRRAQYEVATKQLERARRRVTQGEAPEIEVIRAESGVGRTLEQIIVADSNLRIRQRALKRLMNRGDLPVSSATPLKPASDPNPMGLTLDGGVLSEQAVANRMEMLELELQLAIDSSEVDFRRNAALPLFVVDYGYNAQGPGTDVGDAYGAIGDADSFNVGLRAEIPLGNEAATSRVQAAILARVQRLATREARIM